MKKLKMLLTGFLTLALVAGCGGGGNGDNGGNGGTADGAKRCV